LIAGDVGEGEADFIALRDPELPVLKIPALGRSLRIGDDLRAFVAIRRAIRDYRPDIVHTHTAKAGLLGRIAAATCRVPVRVHTFHGHVLHGYFNKWVTRIIRIVEGLLARQTSALVTVGNQVRDDLIRAGIGRANQYVVIPPGVALGALPDQVAARGDLGLPMKQPVVLFVGRLTSIKRPDRLIEATGLVLKRRPDVILAIAGEGDRLEETRVLAEPLGPSVRFLGWQQDIAALYAAADCMVLTSDNEGMPVTLIEAAMAGVPSVTTDVGSAREVVLNEVTGIVVESSASAVADGLIRLLDGDLRDKMGTAARARAESEFGTKRLVADHEALYERLLVSDGSADAG
jgi:glycosyltransferase involved in cell wall biosynthesis